VLEKILALAFAALLLFGIFSKKRWF